jgi:hypothetical protein
MKHGGNLNMTGSLSGKSGLVRYYVALSSPNELRISSTDDMQ